MVNGSRVRAMVQPSHISPDHLLMHELLLYTDPYILLWDFHQDNLHAPSHTYRGPLVRDTFATILTQLSLYTERRTRYSFQANVFALAFSTSGQYLLS